MKIKRYRNWPILLKIMSIPILSLLLIVLGTQLVIVPRIESWLMEQEKLKVQSVVEIAYQQIIQGALAVEQRKLTVEEAQKEVVARVKELRYAGKEYFWINDLSPRMIMHPTKPELDGTDLTDYKDPSGKRLFKEFVAVCQGKGEGFVEYMWPKPNETTPSPKISFVKLYEPWGWIIGSGLYVDAFQAKVANLHRFIMAASLFVSLLLVFLAWSVGRGIKRSLGLGCSFAAAVASGDLTGTVSIKREDETGSLGSSLNSMVNGLRSMIGRVIVTAGELTRSAEEIAGASRKMVSSAEQQMADVAEVSAASVHIHQLTGKVSTDVDGLHDLASESSSAVTELAASIDSVAGNMESLAASVDGISVSINQMTESIRNIDGGVQTLTDTAAATAASVHEFDASIRQIEVYAKESAAISGEVRNDAETGRKAVEETIAGINGITAASRVAADAIGALSLKAENIGSIVTVIDEIARQTNLLALNASIIAAQTGEHGKGFGVVAAEIKQLAERTTQSTREIAEAISGVQTETGKAVDAIALAEDSIKTGHSLSLEARGALGQIVGGVERTAVQLAEIARATREQAVGSDQIRSAMEHVTAMANSIAGTTFEQRKVSELIYSEVGRVREFSSEVMLSMKEQAKVGDMISHMTRQVSESCSAIREACMEQAGGSLRIKQMVISIQSSTAAVLDETKVVDKGLTVLGANTASLQQEMSAFNL
jgi:methyl-accepting chemotaxis protein